LKTLWTLWTLGTGRAFVTTVSRVAAAMVGYIRVTAFATANLIRIIHILPPENIVFKIGIAVIHFINAKVASRQTSRPLCKLSNYIA
jgi:hypothetical protein